MTNDNPETATMDQPLLAALSGDAAGLLTAVSGVAPTPPPGDSTLPDFAALLQALNGDAVGDGSADALAAQTALPLPTLIGVNPAASALSPNLPGAEGEATAGNVPPQTGQTLPLAWRLLTAVTAASANTPTPTPVAGADNALAAVAVPGGAVPTPIAAADATKPAGPPFDFASLPLPPNADSQRSTSDRAPPRDARTTTAARSVTSGTAASGVLQQLAPALEALADVLMPATARPPDAAAGVQPHPLPTLAEAPVALSTPPPSPAADQSFGAAGVTATVSAAKPEMAMPVPPQHPNWSQAFAERVTFAVKQQLQEAELRLNPPQLGQIEVRISLQQDQASLLFTSPHGAVRDAIEASLGRLRESLSEGGFNLVNVDVSDKSLAQERRGHEAERRFGHASGYADATAEYEPVADAPQRFAYGGDGRVDCFA